LILRAFQEFWGPAATALHQPDAVQVGWRKANLDESDIQYYDAGVDCVSAYDLFDGKIYAVRWPSLSRWSGTHFDPATSEELRDFQAGRVGASVASRTHPWEFDNVDGWSMRVLGQTSPRYQLVLNGQPVTILFSGETWPPRELSIALTRLGQLWMGGLIESAWPNTSVYFRSVGSNCVLFLL
jgi:hypothetical protein